MLKQSPVLNLEQQQALAAFDKETRVSNLNQAKLGKRVGFNEKSFFVNAELEEQTYRDDKTGKTISFELIKFSEVTQSGKEPLLYKMQKEEAS